MVYRVNKCSAHSGHPAVMVELVILMILDGYVDGWLIVLFALIALVSLQEARMMGA